MAFGKGPKTARQIAASKRNIVMEQRRSAELRRMGYGAAGSTNFYGTGRQGRRAARRSTYGQRKHGLSIAQQTRRKQRRQKWAGRVSKTAALGAGAAYVYMQSTHPYQRSKHKAQVKNYGLRIKTNVKYRTSGLNSQIKRGMRHR